VLSTSHSLPRTPAGLLCATGALFVTACGTDALVRPSSAATLVITTVTTGLERDADGYQLTLDGTSAGSIASSGRVILPDLVAGAHPVHLEGIAENCRVAGDNPQTVSVESGDTARISFAVTCAAAAVTLRITTRTRGPLPDQDGYLVSLDGAATQAIGSLDSLQLNDIQRGDHGLAVTGIADHCTLDGSNPRSFAVSGEADVEIALEVSCAALRVSISTEGTSPDTNGYRLSLDGSPPMATDVNAVTDFPLAAGDHTLELSGIAQNCTATDNPRHVVLEPAAQTAAAFVVTCLGQAPAPEGLLYWGGAENHIYRIRADREANLARGSYGVWSPDGSRIAFQSFANDGLQIWVMHPDGTGLLRLGPGAGPSWSPDGGRIVFANGGLKTMRVDGSDVQPLTDDASDGSPAWSPDGTQIAFHRKGECRVVVFLDVICAADLYTIEPDGSGLKRRTVYPAGTSARNPAWSPDGQYVAYGQNVLFGTSSIQILNAATSEPRRLTSNSGRFPSSPIWSPDGSQIVFADASFRGDDARLIGMPAAGGAMTILTVTVTPAYPSSWRP
jgi:hypothetical protein